MSTVTLNKSRLIIATIIVVAVIGGGAYYFVSSMNKADVIIAPSQTPMGGLSFMLDENAKEFTGSAPENRSGNTGGIKIPGYGTVTLPANMTNVKMILLNPEGNPCYFSFELVVDGETYYTSDMVPPSMCVEDLTLTKPLEKGEYTALLKIRTWSLDEGHHAMNGANVEFELKVI